VPERADQGAEALGRGWCASNEPVGVEIADQGLDRVDVA
jgi:hypothetical protein